LPKLTIVSPDAGGVENAARAFAKRLNAELAMVNKRRLEANVAQVMNVIGDVEGQTCLVVDDMIDTAGTLMKTVRR
jgi:ribose-phosphate pyrophosphokinase